ncbi:MAG: cytochrome c [Verrucomicrobiaceae bacterium]|nr:MAG: cytochrome c [Verrucomicrobiaceae bacterium]
MSLPNQKPDLEDSINVTEAHGRLAREAAACAREKRIAPNGSEPISLWLISACGVVLLVAGGVLGGAGKLFNYGASFKEGYVRTPPPGAVETGPAPKEALAAYMARGAKIYSVKCNGCHMSDAKGDGANFPSLVGSAWATDETERFAMIILNGLVGPISTGKTYGGAGGMAAQGAGLSPEDLAGIMTYVRNNFGNTVGDVVTVEMAKAAMEISAKRAKAGQQVTAEELTADHLKALPGEPLDPKALVDPLTLTPVTAAPAAP